MPQQPSPPFWIPGGMLLLIFCILVAPLHGFAVRHVHSDLAQRLLLVATWTLRVAAIAGIVCIVIGVIMAICRKRKE
jgi:ABC-type Fe3+ transport system permease subunit